LNLKASIIPDLENHFPVEKIIYKGACVWSVIRTQLFRDISRLRPKNIEPRSHILPKTSHSEREENYRAAEISFRETLEKCLGRLPESADVVFLSQDSVRARIEERTYHVYFDPLKELLSEQGVSCIHLDSEQREPVESIFSGAVMVVDELAAARRLARAWRHLNVPRSPIFPKEFYELTALLQAESVPLDLDEYALFARLEELIHMQSFFEAVLERLRPRICFTDCYFADAAMALIRACRNLGIRTADIQHGHVIFYDSICDTMPAYPRKEFETLPDYFWLWGRPTAEAVESQLPEGNRYVIGGHPWLMKWRATWDRAIGSEHRIRRLNEEKIILVSLQPTEDQDIPATIAEAIERSPDSWRWLLRNHPMRLARTSAIMRAVAERGWPVGKVEVERATSIPLFFLLKQADYHVTRNSSTAFEAEALGVTNIIYSEDGREFYADAIVRGYYLFAKSPDEMISMIARNEKAIVRPSPVCESSREIAEDALNILLDWPESIQRDIVKR
jgi:hypothetical protein